MKTKLFLAVMALTLTFAVTSCGNKQKSADKDCQNCEQVCADTTNCVKGDSAATCCKSDSTKACTDKPCAQKGEKACCKK